MSFCSLISVILFSLWIYFHLWFNFLFFSFLSFITSVNGNNLDFLVCAFYWWDFLFISDLLNLLLITSNGTKCYLVTLYLLLKIYHLFLPGFMWRFLFVCEIMSCAKSIILILSIPIWVCFTFVFYQII